MKTEPVKENNMDIQEVLQNCIESAYLNRAPNTARAYRNGINVFRKYLDEVKIEASSDESLLTVELFISSLPWLLQKGYTKKTVNVYSSAFKYLMDWLVINRSLRPDYSQSLRWTMAVKSAMRKREDKMPRFPTLEQPDLMRKAVQELPPARDTNVAPLIAARDTALIEFLYCSGCRNNEVRSLLVGDINLKARQVIVTGKGDKQRPIFITQKVVDMLREYWKLRGYANPKDPAFARHDVAVGDKRERISSVTVRKVVNRTAAWAGIEKGKFTPHFFRHAFAIKMLRETGNLALVQDMLGHASPQATRVYAKIYPDDLRDAHREVFEKE